MVLTEMVSFHVQANLQLQHSCKKKKSPVQTFFPFSIGKFIQVPLPCNHRTAWLEKDLKDHLLSTLLLWAAYIRCFSYPLKVLTSSLITLDSLLTFNIVYINKKTSWIRGMFMICIHCKYMFKDWLVKCIKRSFFGQIYLLISGPVSTEVPLKPSEQISHAGSAA